MSCPNISNENVRNKINKIVNMLGGRSLSIEEFRDKKLRAKRSGLDYFAMDTAYAMWDSFDETTIDSFIKYWEVKEIVGWKYGVDRLSKMEFLQNVFTDYVSDKPYEINVLDIAAFFKRSTISNIKYDRPLINVLKLFIVQCEGSPLDFNFYQLSDGSIKITAKGTLNILPGVKISESTAGNIRYSETVNYSDSTKKLYLYSIILYETSIESAEQLLSDVSDQFSQDDINAALGMLIKKICNTR